MKECYWCKKQCPLDEEGSFELEPDTEKEVGWICDHCVLAFDGKCDCQECTANTKAAQKALAEYDLAHSRGQRSSQVACVLFALPFLILLVLYIVDWCV